MADDDSVVTPTGDFSGSTEYRQIGPYRLLEKIGEGGFGEVWAAQQTSPVQRRVAVKIIKRGMDTREVIARFEAERQALAMMDHPHVAKIYDAGETEDGLPYFAMELVRGTRITDYCDENRLPIEGRLDLFVNVCNAIQHAHQKGIIHRDIKPSNILVTHHDSVPVPKVIDFGIAKAIHQDLTDKTVYTRLHQFIGTPAYTSPEQLEMSGIDVDTRSDIYSLGVLLYEMLVGRTPFDNKQLVKAGFDEIRKAIRETDPPRPSSRFGTLGADEQTTTARSRRADPRRLLSDLKGDLDWIVLKCLEKDRVRRYPTANELSADLSRFLNNELVTATPPSMAYRVQKFAQRYWKSVAVATAIATTLALATAFSAWQAANASRQSKLATAAKLEAVRNAMEAETARTREEKLRITAEELKARADADLEKSRQHSYAADVGLAHAAMQRGDYGAARGLLKYQAKVSPDLLGIEWRLLWKQVEGVQAQKIGPFSTTVCSVCPIEGDLLAVGTVTEGVYLCDLRNGRILRTLSEPEDTPSENRVSMNKLVYLEKHRRLVHFSRTGIQVWQGPDWTDEQVAENERNSRFYNSATVSPNGRFVAGIAFDGHVVIWSAPSMEFVGEIAAEALPYSQTLVFAGDSTIAVGNREKLEVWKFQPEPFDASTIWEEPYDTSSICSRSNQLITAGWSGVLTIWDLTNGEKLAERAKAHNGFIFGMATNEAGDVLYTGGKDQLVAQWKLPSLTPLGTLPGHGNEVWSIRNQRGDQMVSCGRDRSVRIWNPEKDATQRTPMGLTGVCLFSPDGKYLVGRHRAHEVGYTIWETSKFARTVSLKSKCRIAGFNNAGKVRVARLDEHLTVSTIDSATGAEGLTQHFSEVQSMPLIWNTGLSHFAVQAGDSFQLWSIESGDSEFALPSKGRLRSISRDGDVAAAIDDDDWTKINLWKRGMDEPTAIASGVTQDILSTDFSPDGSQFVVSSIDGSLSFWNVSDGSEAARVITGDSPGRIRYADARTLIGWDGYHVRFWNVPTKREIMRVEKHDPEMRHVWLNFTVSPDGRFMAIARSTEDTEIWHTPFPKMSDVLPDEVD